jgi:hypothetical protein
MENLYGKYGIVVTEENNDNDLISVSCTLEFSKTGVCLAAAG